MGTGHRGAVSLRWHRNLDREIKRIKKESKKLVSSGILSQARVRQ